jgi:hypothetical protein
MEVTMWKRLCCVPVTAELEGDSRKVLLFRIDYRRVDGQLEHSFQIGELIDGRWKRKDRFDDIEFFITHHGTGTCHKILDSLRREGSLEDPEAAQRFVDLIVEEAERDNEERKRTAGAKAAFIQMFHYLSHGLAVLLVFIGGALLTSPVALVPALALVLVFEPKRRIEEAWLLKRYPEYAEYRRRVPHALVPSIW